MSIRMPIKFHGSYKVVTRRGATEKQEICQKLTVTPLAGEKRAETAGSPTHLVMYFCFGCRRILEGTLKENREDRVVFQVEDAEFEFCPSSGIC